MSASHSTGVEINGNIPLTKVPSGFCQFTLPGTQCVSGENWSEVSTWLSLVRTKEIRVQPGVLKSFCLS